MTLPIVALTFDYHPEAYTAAFPLMNSRGLVGTYFVDPDSVNATGGPVLDNLTIMKIFGWTIGAYSGVNMVNQLSADRNATMARFANIKTKMLGYGFPVKSLAAAQRAWDGRLRNLAVNLFERVRVADQFVSQAYPVNDPLWITKGGQPSLSSNDTAASLNQNVTDFLTSGAGLWNIVIHKVGVDTDPMYSVTTAAFTALLDRLATEVAAGTLQVLGYDQLP